MKTTTSRAIAAGSVLAATLVAGVLAAPAASAHVTVDGDAEKGGYTRVAVRVPTERDDASTVEVELDLNAEEYQIRSVRVQPTPGWDYEMETIEVDASEVELSEDEQAEGIESVELVSKITWSGGEVAPGEFVEFPVSMGRMPEDIDELILPAIQTYDSDEVVEWIEVAAPDAEERPESPAPVLPLSDPPPEGEEGGGDGAGDEAASTELEDVASDSDVSSVNALAIVGILIGLAGVGIGTFSLVKGRRA